MSETGSYCTNILLGDSKKALISLSVPMMIAMLIMSLYNVVDAIWVSGLGSLALAATGFVAPFYMIIYGIGEGLGMGAGSAIARHIGENNHSDANNAGNHALILTIIVSIISAIVFFLFSDSLFDLIGAGEAAALASDYAVIVCGLGIFTIYSNVIAAVLRSEGDAKRSMYALIAGGILNIFLDPVLIYILGWGITGAAWATVISVALSSVILYYWTMIKKDTYVRYNLKFFSFKKEVLSDILKVGVPASIEQVSMSITMFVIDLILVIVATANAVAVYTAGFRVLFVAMSPLIGIGTAVMSIEGAAYGARNFKKLRGNLLFSARFGLLVGICLGLLMYIFAPYIAMVFSYTESSADLAAGISEFLKIISITLPFLGFGIFAASFFQGIGKGIQSLCVTLFRSAITTILFAWFFGLYLDMGVTGVWYGIVVGEIAGNLIGFIWAYKWTHNFCKNINNSPAVQI